MFLESIIHFNMASLFIFGIIIFYVIYRGLYKAYSSFIFLLINVIYTIVCVIDLFVSFGGMSTPLNQTFMFLYYLLKYIASIVYLLYIILITHSEDIIRNKRNGTLFSIPFVITVGFLISNLFTGMIYYYDEAGIYHRGDYIFVFYGLTFVYVLIGFIWLVYNRKMFDFSDRFSLFAVYIFSIVALIVQYFFPDVLIEMLATSLAMLFLSSTTERSQLVVDPKTGLKNKVIFRRICMSSFKRKKEVGVVLFYIKNYSVLYEKYRYDVAIRNTKILSSYLSKAFLSEIRYECYYLEGGIYAFETKTDDTGNLAEMLDKLITNTYDKKVDFNIDYVICSTIIPTDFESYEEYSHFVYNFTDTINTTKRVISTTDIKNENKNQLINLDEVLDRVIQNKDIMVEFQPIYNLSEKKYTVIEALARINDPEFGLLYAESFIPYAEKKDKIYDIDMLIIDKVYDFYSTTDLDSMGISHISINLSFQTLCNKNFLEDLNLLELKYGVTKKKIYFEIKERERHTFKQHSFDTIQKMMDEGYLFSIDNYGIGCMPVDNLVKVPFSNVKFDGTFAKSCVNKETCIIIDNTIKLVKKLNKGSICAGVEDENSAKILEALEPDYIQGYYYSKPLSLDNLIAFLIEHNK